MATALDPLAFRDAMARFASGVTVVSTSDVEGRNVGFTASSFSSLSLDPPLLLVCLQKDADCYAAFMQAGHFAVSILALGQEEIARRFATKAIDKLQDTPMQAAPMTGLPVIEGASAWTECVLRERVDGGDHTILIGEVVHAESADAEPLLHFNRQFGRFLPGGPPAD
jgi:flavin reductase ActVB